MKKAIVVLLSVFFPLNFCLMSLERLSICEMILYPSQIAAYEGKEVEIEGYAVEIKTGIWILAASPIILPCCKKMTETNPLFLEPSFAKGKDGKKLKLHGKIENRDGQFFLYLLDPSNT